MTNTKLQNIKSTGFKIPDQYLDALDDEVISKLKTEVLQDKVNASGYKVPDDYFGTLEASVLDKITNDTPNSKVISLVNKRTLLYVSSIAAAVLLVFSLNTLKTKPSFKDLATNTVEDYILDEGINAYDIASLLSEEQLEGAISIEHDIDANHIEAYLLENEDLTGLIID
jgi:hypothetical protein